MKRGSIMPWFFAVALLMTVAIATFPVFAEEIRFHTGQQLQHSLSVCIAKQDAVDVLTSHSKDGFEKASEVWTEKEKLDKCGTVPVIGPTVGQVVFNVKVKKDGREWDAKVVEIVADGKVVGYFLTSAPVENKRDRNA